MESVSRRYPVARLGAVAILVPALLFSGGGCSQAMQGGPGMMAQQHGLDGPPGNDELTKRYARDGIHFDANEYGYIDATFIADNVLVRIEPEVNSDTVNWHGALTDELAFGKFVARIQRLNNQDSPTLGLDQNHKYSYLWVGQIDGKGKRAAAFYTFNNDWTIYKAAVTPITRITRCRDNSARRPAVKINYSHVGAKCKDVTGLAAFGAGLQRAVQLASVTPNVAQALPMEGGLWISCSGGCCDIGAFQ